MFIHNINPVLISFWGLEIRYYGLIFLIGFIIAYLMLPRLSKKAGININKEKARDYILYIAVGVMLGARLLYCFVYNPWHYFKNPLEIFFIWQGGLSFHGGIIGGVITAILFTIHNSSFKIKEIIKNTKTINKSEFRKKLLIPLLKIGDISVIPLSIALALGRIANFINGELVGRMTNVPWCVMFQGFQECRHPSQLYESVKNIIIFIILLILFYHIYSNKKTKEINETKQKKESKIIGLMQNLKKPGIVFSLFIILYSVLRFIVEYFRMPDSQLGFIILKLSMGQILSIITFIIGLILFIHLIRNDKIN